MQWVVRSRQQLEPRLYRGILVRIVSYSVCYLLLQALIVARFFPAREVWQVESPRLAEILHHLIPSACAIGLLLPVVFFDARTLLHRLAGPMLRMNRAVRRLADGESVELMRFRKHDYWGDMAENFNRLLTRLQRSASGPRGNRSAQAASEGRSSNVSAA